MTTSFYKVLFALCLTLCLAVILPLVDCQIEELHSGETLYSISSSDEAQLIDIPANIQQINVTEVVLHLKNSLEGGNHENTNVFESFSKLWFSQDYDVQIQLSRALVQQKLYDVAERLLSILIKTRTSDNQSSFEAQLLLGKLYIIKENWLNAENLFNSIMNDYFSSLSREETATVYSSLAKISLRRDGDASKALQLLILAWGYNNDYKIAFEIGVVLLETKSYQEAKHWFDKSESLNPNFDYKLLGKIYSHYNLHSLGRNAFSKVVEKNSRDAEALLLLAECSEKVGEALSAYNHYQSVLKFEPHNALAHSNLGFLLLGIGANNYGAPLACGNEYVKIALKHLTFANRLDSSMKRVSDVLAFCQKELDEANSWHVIASNLTSYTISNTSMPNEIEPSDTIPSIDPAPSNEIVKTQGNFKTVIQKIIVPARMIFNLPRLLLNTIGLGFINDALDRIFDVLPFSTKLKTLFGISNNDLDMDSNYEDISLELKIDNIEKSWKYRSSIVDPIIKEQLSSSGELYTLHVAKKYPVVLKSIIDHWSSAASNFTTDFIINKFGHMIVRTSVSKSDRFHGVESGKLWGLSNDINIRVRPPKTSMLLKDFIILSNLTEETFFVENSSLDQYLGQAFVALVPVPSIIANITSLQLISTSLFLGTKPTTSVLQYDVFDSFLCQVRGRSEIILFAPNDLENLYYLKVNEGILEYNYPSNFTRALINKDDNEDNIHRSILSINKPDLKKYPKYVNAKPYHVILEAGEVLYIPAFWHYEVQVVPDRNEHISLAVKFWFNKKME